MLKIFCTPIFLVCLYFVVKAEETPKENALVDSSKTKIPGQNDKCAAYCYATYSPHTSEQMEIVVKEGSPISKYAHSLMDGMFDSMEDMHRNMMNNFKSWWPSSSSSSNTLGDIDKEMDEMHRHMNRMMEGMLGMGRGRGPQHHMMDYLDRERQHQERELQQNSENGKPWFAPGSEFKGKQVGNSDDKGEEILKVRMYGPVIRKGEDGETVIDFGPFFSGRRHEFDHYDRTGTADSLKAYDPSPPVDPTRAVDPDASWLACLARRARRLSSITRWLVCFALFLCVLCMIWICLSIMKTAPKRKVLYATKAAQMQVSEVPPVNTEKKFLMESFAQPQDPPPPYFHEEGEPLPVKATTA